MFKILFTHHINLMIITSKVKSIQDITKTRGWAGTFLLPAETSHFGEQIWIHAPRDAGILHTEQKPWQKE